MSLFAKAKKARENKKGFTLVELIVVLVILAILAAILVPALLGWIDRAREKQFVLEGRNIVLAAQTMADEAYAAGDTDPSKYVKDKVGEIAEIADVKDLSVTSFDGLSSSTTAEAANHAAYTITGATGLEWKSPSGYTVKASMKNGAWTIAEYKATPATPPAEK